MQTSTKLAKTQELTLTALLISLGIAIPMFMPLKLIIPPASYTLASHVPIFMALLIQPSLAVSVAIGTSIGFLLSGFPLVIVARALSHLIFVLWASKVLNKKDYDLGSTKDRWTFSLLTGLIHGLGEILAALIFFPPGMGNAWYVLGILVGFGTLLHSLVDFELAYHIYKNLRR